jgi:hypothetical protein
MTALKSVRTLAASLGVLAIGAMAASPAMAFDKVNWTWNNKVDQTTDIDVYIDVDVDSTGLVQVEKLQMFFGSVTAESRVSNIHNYQYDVASTYIADPRTYCYCRTQYIEIEGNYDALKDLPQVISTATAVGNNQSITSDVPVFLHDGQFLAGGFSNYYTKDEVIPALLGLVGAYAAFDAYGDKNLHTATALALTAAAAGGIITKADIKATSDVYDIKNAAVNSTSTAVANNIAVTLESKVDGLGGYAAKTGCGNYCGTDALSNHVLIADITQWAYADVKATSNVRDVSFSDYKNLGLYEGLGVTDANDAIKKGVIVNSVATAVGNNVAITVGVPAP